MTANAFQYQPPDFTPDETRPLPTHVQDLIVGSGPGASVVASHLAKAGRQVTLLEEGPARTTQQFGNFAMSDVFGQMYRTGGGFPVLGGPGTPPMLLVIARCKGGGTVVNGAVCYRTTEDVVEGWRDDIGLNHIANDLWKGYALAEKRIGVTSMGDLHSAATLKVKAGAEKLGWAHHDVHRNTPGCKGTSRCLSGCAHGSKQSMLQTYLHDAETHGAVVYPDTHVSKLEGDFGKVRTVKGTRAGKAFKITAERVFLAAGAVFTPFLMLKSGIKHLRAIGRHLTVHPSTRAYYMFDEQVNAWEGAFQSFAVHQFRNEGIHIISLFPPPATFALSLPGVGPELRQMMSQIPNMGIMGGLISDHSEGRVFASPFRNFPAVQYTMSPQDKAKLLRTISLLGELGFAAGAKALYLPFNWRPAVKNHAELHAQVNSNVAAHDFEVTAQHPLGTCRMGYDEDLSVVREDGRVHGYENLYVIDSSVIPTSIGVNPMLTILAFAEVMGQSLVNS